MATEQWRILLAVAFSDRRLITLAYHRVARLHLSSEEESECISVFLSRALTFPSPASEAFLSTCCGNAVWDYLRVQQRIRRGEVCWPPENQSGGDRENGLEKVPDVSSHDLYVEVLRTELHKRLQTVILCLSPQQQEIIQYYVLEERSASEVAQLTGRTPHAVRQAASLALKRLRGLLERQGFDESEAQDYLACLNRTRTARENNP